MIGSYTTDTTGTINDYWNWTNPSPTTTTIPKITIDSEGIKGNGFSISGTSINLNPDTCVSTSNKFVLDGEEITSDDIKFIHELQKQLQQEVEYTCDLINQDKLENIKKKIQNQEKGSNMDMMKNFNFGPCGDRAKISHLGIAVQNSNGEWVSYDKENNEIVNVDLINFGCDNFVYMMPVAIKDVVEGDAIIHNRHVMFVTRAKGKALQVIDVTDGEIKKILPTKSVFGFDFVTKIVSLVDFTASAANEDNPFGNMLPFLLLSNDNNRSNDVLPLAFMLMNKDGLDGGLFSSSTSSTQMMLMAMMMTNGRNGCDMQNLLPLMFLVNENTKTATS